MRPLCLSIEGLRSFRAPVEIDFRDRDHVAVIGDTGAGKSSILEAMTYALYGGTTFSRRSNPELMNDTSQRTRVVLRFRVSGEEWEVARALRRTQQGKVQPAGVQLRRTSPEGEMVEQVRHVDERVKELLGLDRDAFLRTVVLPQGRFARLLVEDKPGERSEILRQVWPMDGIDAVRTAAEAALERVEAVHRRVDDAASQYPEDPGARRDELVRLREEAERRAREAGALEEEAKSGRNKLKEAERRMRAASEVAANLSVDRIDRASEPVGRLEAVAAEIAEEDRRLEERQAEARKVLDGLGPDEEQRRREVATALDGLKRLGGLAEQAMDCAKDWRSKKAAAEDGRRKVSATQEDEARASEAATRHERERAPLAGAVETARRRCEETRRRHQEGASRQRDLDRARKQLAEAQRQRTILAGEFERAAKNDEAAQAASARAEALLTDARRADSAASVAGNLEAGDDCPVCARELPSGWSAPEAADLDEAKQSAKRARADAREASNAASTARARLGDADEQIAKAKSEQETADKSFQNALAELAAVGGVAGLGDSTAVADAAPRFSAGLAADAAFGEAPAAATPDATPETGVVRRRTAVSGDATAVGAPDATAAPTDESPNATRPAELPGLDALIGPFDDVQEKAAEALRLHDKKQAKLADAAHQRATAAAETRAKAEGAQQLADAARKHGESALKALVNTVAAIAEPFRPALKLPADVTELEGVDTAPATDCIKAAEAQAQTLAAREKQRRELQEALDQASKEREALALRRKHEVEAPLHEVGAALSRERDALLGSASALDANDDPIPGPVPSGPPVAVRAWSAELRGATIAMLGGADREAKAASAAAGAARTSLIELGLRLAEATTRTAEPLEVQPAQGGDLETPKHVAAQLDQAPQDAPPERDQAPRGIAPELAPEMAAARAPAPARDPDAVVAAAAQAAEDARHLGRDAVRRASEFAAIHDDVATLRALATESRDLKIALSDLRRALLSGGFPKWLTLRRSRTLLLHASQALADITRGRYAFEDPGDREEWRIVDKESGEPRSPSSLSGGEQFVASLALAVGMVEAIARTGDRLDALFLDEGFGALDRNNLDAAVEALSAVAARGRMVGVISHVRAVAEQIDHVLEVARSSTGSEARWLTREERGHVSHADAGQAASEAMGALLD